MDTVESLCMYINFSWTGEIAVDEGQYFSLIKYILLKRIMKILFW